MNILHLVHVDKRYPIASKSEYKETSIKDKIATNIDNGSTQCLSTRPPKAATTRLVSRLSKEVEQPAQIPQLNKDG